jgi:hypothetical protein
VRGLAAAVRGRLLGQPTGFRLVHLRLQLPLDLHLQLLVVQPHPGPRRLRHRQHEDDEYHDRGELPPIRDVPWLPDIPAPKPRRRKKGGAAEGGEGAGVEAKDKG